MTALQILIEMQRRVNLEYEVADTQFEESDILEKSNKLGQATAYLNVMRHINDLIEKV